MSNNKKTKKFKWGGARKNAGRPEGKTKAKICVSVNEQVWQAALNHWQGKASRLVENLLSGYVNGEKPQSQEAAC